jgi:hypothetical protein
MSSVRVDWEAVPAMVRDAVMGLVQSSVRKAVSIPGGFSPGLIGELSLDDGRAIFVKGCSTTLNPRTPTMHADEIRVLQSLPHLVPHAQIIGAVVVDDWTLLITEFLVGRSAAEIPVTTAAAAGLVQAFSEADAGLFPRLDERLADDFLWNGLQRLQRGDVEPTCGWRLHPWVRSNMAQVLRLEALLPEVLRGEALVHGDLRADNVMVMAQSDLALRAIDWPAAARGNSLFDAVLLAGSLAHVRDLNPGQFLAEMQGQLGEPEDDQIAVLLAGFVGHYSWASSLPEPPGIVVRGFQQNLANVFVHWLQQHLASALAG